MSSVKLVLNSSMTSITTIRRIARNFMYYIVKLSCSRVVSINFVFVRYIYIQVIMVIIASVVNHLSYYLALYIKLNVPFFTC